MDATHTETLSISSTVINAESSDNDDGEGFASTEDELRLTKRKLEEISISHYEETSKLRKEIESRDHKLKEVKVSSNSKDILFREFERERLDSEKELQELKAVVTDLRNEKGKLQLKVNQLELALSEKGEEESEITEEFLKVQETLKAAENEKLDFENAVRTANDKLFQCESEKDSLLFVVNDLKEQLQVKEKAMDVLKREVESSTEEIKTLNSSVRERRKDVTELRGKLGELESQNRNLAMETNELRHVNAFLKKDFETCKTEKASAAQRLREAEENRRINDSSVRHEMDQLSKAENRMRQRCLEMEGMLSDMMKERDHLELRNSTSESRIKALESRLVEIQDEKTDTEFQLNGICSVLRKTFHLHIGNPIGMYRSSLKEKDDDGTEDLRNTDDDVSDGLPFDPDELSQSLSSWSKRVTLLESEREKLTELIEMQRKKTKLYEEEIESLKKDLGNQREQTEAHEKSKSRMEQQFTRIEETLSLQEHEIARKCSEIAGLVEENTSLKRKVSVMEINIKDASQRAFEMDSKSELVTKDKISLQKELSLLEYKYSKLDKSKKKLENELKKLHGLSNDTMQENRTLKEHLQVLIEDNRVLAEKALNLEQLNAGAMKENTITAKNVEKQIKEITKLRKELKALDKMMRQKDSFLRDSNSTIEDLTSRLNDYDISYNSLKETTISLERDLEKYRRNDSTLCDKLKVSQEMSIAVERRLLDNEEELKRTNKAFKEQNKTVEQLKCRTELLQNEKESIKEELLLLQDEVVRKDSTIGDLKDSGRKGLSEIEQLKSQLSKKQREYEKLQGSLVNTTEEKLFLDRSMRQLEDEKENMKTQLHNMNVKMADMVAEYEKKYILEAKNDIQLLQSENDRLQSHIQEIEDERIYKDKTQSQRISSLEAQVSSLRLELKKETRLRQHLEDMYSKKDDEMDRFRSTFDHSLNTITQDTKNLKVILDKSLHKLDKQILVGQGLASDTDATTSDIDEPLRGEQTNLSSRKEFETSAKAADSTRSRYRLSYSPHLNQEPSSRKSKAKSDSEHLSKNTSLRNASPQRNGSSSVYKSPGKHHNVTQSGIY